MKPSSCVREVVGGFAVVAALMGSLAETRGDEPSTLASRVRQPIALAFSDDGARLYVANRRSGSVSVIDVREAETVAEATLGRSLVDLVELGDGRHFVVIDRAACALMVIEHQGAELREVGRVAVGIDPVRVAVASDGRACAVASTWGRRLTFVTIERPGELPPRVVGVVELPFSPRNVLYVQGGTRLIATDAFGGRLAVVDPAGALLERVRKIPAHNIRGLTLSADGKSVVLAHQLLTITAPTTRADVHWGVMIANQLRTLRIDKLLSDESDDAVVAGGRISNLGASLDGAGDPGGVAFNRRGDLIVALTGVNEVAITLTPSFPLCRASVGLGPTAVAPSPDGATAAVADTLGDTVSIVYFDTCRRIKTIPLGPRPLPTAADRGERLFHDAGLSHDNWLSCQSCHTDGHTNGLRSDTLGDASFGAPKQVPSLLGVRSTGPWAWLGAVDTLEEQVEKSITTTMRGRPPSAEQVADLAAYLRTLAPPSPRPARDPASDARGRSLFATACASCHEPPTYTTPRRIDVGLVDEVGNRRFNPPSLLGAGRRDAFFHDGRARSLFEVLTRFGHPPEAGPFEASEIADLIAFLEAL